MKTQMKGFSRFLKNLATVSMTAAIMISCGGSGDDNFVGTNGFGIQNYSGIQGINGQALTQQLSQVAQANPCRTQSIYGNQGQGQRVRISSQAPVNTNTGAYHIGITAEGDVAVIYNQGGQSRLDVYACRRPGMGNQMQIVSQPYVDSNPICQVAEISALNVQLQAQYQPYGLAFYPIYFGNSAGLCQ